MRKYEAAGKDNIQIFKNKITMMDIKIKGMDIGHFHEHIDSLTT